MAVIAPVNTLYAQSYLPSNRKVYTDVQNKVFLHNPNNTSIIDSSLQCITTANAKTWLAIDESVLPTDGRLPWYSELHPATETCATTDSVMYPIVGNAAYASCGSMIYTSFSTAMSSFVRVPITTTYWIGASADHTSQCSYTPLTTKTASVALAPASLSTNSLQVSGDTTSQKLAMTTLVANSTDTAFKGPLNRCGVWGKGGSEPGGIWEHFNFHVNITTAKAYYIGIGCDNYFRIRIDGVLLVDYEGDSEAFKIWHIFPATLSVGYHVVSFEAKNDKGGGGAFGAQMYNNTSTEIRNATSDAGLTFMFDTRNVIGQKICAMAN